MITAIREVRRAKGLTLDEVAARCVPPTTAQTVGRLETGTRTVSVKWLNRIAAALEVEAGDLVALPTRPGVPVAAILDAQGARGPRRTATLATPAPSPGMVALTVAASVGDYPAGDAVWIAPLPPERFAEAVNRDVLAPLPAGRFAFGRLVALDPPTLLAPLAGAKPVVVEGTPAWLGVAVRLVREL